MTPSSSNLRYLSFATHRLSSDAFAPLAVGQVGSEALVITLAGGVIVTFNDGAPPVRLPGRPSAFEGLPWAIYLPVGRVGAVEPLGGWAEIALMTAPASGRADATDQTVVIDPERTTGVGRGATAVLPASFPAHRLLVFEALVPAEGWWPWPPHRHDRDNAPGETALEEVGHVRFAEEAGRGTLRVYTADGGVDARVPIANGDTVVVSGGYHTLQSRGADAYFLTALAGDRRAWAASFDPAASSGSDDTLNELTSR